MRIAVSNHFGLSNKKVFDGPEYLDVEAWCVSNVRAYFLYEEHAGLRSKLWFCVAYGDDDHWWIGDRMDPAWARKCLKTFSLFCEDNQKELEGREEEVRRLIRGQ